MAVKDAICIIGMHRSGTSMVANLLRRCGLTLGRDDELMGASESNQLGHFEHTGFLEINEALLRHLGGSWDDPPDLKPGWEQAPALDTLLRNARLLVDSFAEDSIWGWKEPRTTILVPFWRRLVPNLRFVICVRNPSEVAQSVSKRDGLSHAVGAHLWSLYTRAAIRDTRDQERIFTFYEDYFHDSASELKRIAAFCQLECPESFAIEREVFSRDLRHHDSEWIGLLDDEDIPSEYKLLYLGLRALSLDDSSRCRSENDKIERFSNGASKLASLLDEFGSGNGVARLQRMMAENELRWSKSKLDLAATEAKLLDLQQDNARLKVFSDAVRRTLVYRLYGLFIRPFRSR